MFKASKKSSVFDDSIHVCYVCLAYEAGTSAGLSTGEAHMHV